MAPPRIVSVTKNGSNPAYQGARLGMDRYARKRGLQVAHWTPVVDDSIPEQKAHLQSLRSSPPDALLISASHPSELDDVIEQLRSAGTVVVMFVGRTHRPALAHCFVGSDDRAMTRAVARHVAQHIGGRGGAMVLDGNPLGILYEARAAGFRDGLAEHPGVRLLGACDGQFLREPARQAMEALLASLPAPDAVLVANDFMGLGALQALRARGLRPALGSVNATPQGIAALREGNMLVTAAFNAMAMGCLALEAALRVLRGAPVPETVRLPTELVTRENLAQWDLPYERRPLPDWDTVVGMDREAA